MISMTSLIQPCLQQDNPPSGRTRPNYKTGRRFDKYPESSNSTTTTHNPPSQLQHDNSRRKSEKFELLEDLFHSMIKMQPEMSKQMKVNHFHSLLRKGGLLLGRESYKHSETPARPIDKLLKMY